MIDPRIDVHAQYAMQRMFKSENAPIRDLATALLQAVKSQSRLSGIYIENQQVPALLAKKLGIGWWQLIPKGADAAVVVNPAEPSSPGLIVFRDQLRSEPARLDMALQKAWTTLQQSAKYPSALNQVAASKMRGSRPVGEAEFFNNPLGAMGLVLPVTALTRSPIRPLTSGEIDIAKTVFGSSLVYSLILLTPFVGLGNSAFTLYAPMSKVGGVTIINIGSGPFHSPGSNPSLLIHELVHSWQSQHHPTPWAYKANSVASQGGASASKKLTGANDSAYCYRPGRNFAFYAAEQIAKSVENGFKGSGKAHEAAIISHIKSMPPLIPSPLNIASLSVPRWETRGAAGVTC